MTITVLQQRWPNPLIDLLLHGYMSKSERLLIYYVHEFIFYFVLLILYLV